jgi:hypothetical protein
MKRINDENIDEIMFQLLEGEIQGEERKQLLSAIEADEAYNKLWQAWQQTVLSPEQPVMLMDTVRLKKKAGKVIPFNYKYAIAAMLVLGLGLAIFLTNSNPHDPVISEGPKPHNGKQPIIQVPKPEIKNPYETKEDSVSVLPLKEKIRTMAVNPKSENTDNQSIEISPVPEEKPIEYREEMIVKTPEEKKSPIEKPDIREEKPADHIVVTMSSESKPLIREVKQKETLFSRILGKPKFKLENDSSTRTNKRLIIENKQYKIIAGF